jgi:uncharacterized protein with FMN-binding domain
VRKILFALMSTITAVVTMFGYRTSTPHPTTTAVVAASGAGPTEVAGTATSPSPAASATAVPSAEESAAASSPSPSPAATTKTVTGQTVETRWGPVQVQISVTGSTVTAVNLLQVPSGNNRDVEINNYAIPILTQETLQAQSAHIDSVSGATVTTDGYLSSLQSALDQAGL